MPFVHKHVYEFHVQDLVELDKFYRNRHISIHSYEYDLYHLPTNTGFVSGGIVDVIQGYKKMQTPYVEVLHRLIMHTRDEPQRQYYDTLVPQTVIAFDLTRQYIDMYKEQQLLDVRIVNIHPAIVAMCRNVCQYNDPFPGFI